MRSCQPRFRAIGCALVFSCVVQAQDRIQSSDHSFTDQFVLMPWELPPRTKEFADPQHGLQTLANCGFNVASFVRPEHLAACEKLGLRAIISRPEGIIKWRELSDQQIESTIKTLVDESSKSGAVIGYFITDEPGVRDFTALAKAVAAVKRLAPGKLAYINLYPNYATLGAPDLSQLGTNSYDEYLQRFVSEVKPQLISYDNHQVQFSHDLKDAKIAASYFDNLLAIRLVAQEHDLPFWNIVSSNQIRKTTPPPSPANMLLQAWTTLAAGAKGLTWYTYYSGRYQYAPIDDAGNRTATWTYLRLANEQASTIGKITHKLKNTGVYFSGQPPGNSLPALPGKLIQSVTSESPVMIGEFASSADSYAIVVNLSLERSARITITPTSGHDPLGQISPVGSALLPLEEGHALWLSAGQGALIAMR